MDPIQVPAPPRSAYNPQRRVSDLILGQLKHFQHLEQKRDGLNIDPALARDIHTEAGAARYIAAITRALRGQTATKTANVAAMPAKKVPKKTSSPNLALAASAAPSKGTPPSKLVKKPGKPSSKRAK